MMPGPISIRVSIGGGDAYAGGPDSWGLGVPTVLDGLQFVWGRGTVVDQPGTGTCPFTLHQHLTGAPGQQTLFDFVRSGVPVKIYSTVAGVEHLLWSGTVTNPSITQVGDAELEAQVNASDLSVPLSNSNIGADPWPEETAQDRFDHILAATVALGTIPGLSGSIDPTLAGMMIGFRDVDKKPPLALFQDLAQSVGGVCWLTADAGNPHVWIEDPSQRRGLQQFAVDPATHDVSIVPISLDFPGVNEWPAADVLREPLTWTHDPTQSINDVELSWLQAAGLNDQGNPAYEEATVSEVDFDSVRVDGAHSLDLDTQLVDSGDALQLAYRWLLNVHSGEWLLSGVSIDTAALGRPVAGITDEERLIQVAGLLDIRDRIGRRMTITGMPAWSAFGAVASMYVEGGTYTWADGRWQLDLTATTNAIGGGATAQDFADTGVVAADFGSLRAIDIAGVAGVGGFPAGFGAGAFGDQLFGN